MKEILMIPVTLQPINGLRSADIESLVELGPFRNLAEVQKTELKADVITQCKDPEPAPGQARSS